MCAFDLAQINESLPVANIDEKEFTTNAWLPRIQLMTSSTKLVKAAKFLPNHFAVVRGQDYIDMGTSVTAFLLAARAKAMHFAPDATVTSFDPSDPVYQDIKAKSSLKDLPDGQRVYGPEFLLWLPDSKEFVTLFLCSPTSRNEFNVFKSNLKKMVSLTSREIPNKKNGNYFSVTCIASDVIPSDENMPEMEVINEQVNNFLNPPKPTAEAILDSGDERAR